MEISFHKNNLTGNVDLPTSKSLSNRYLILKALSNSEVDIQNLSTANDTVLLNNILNSSKKEQLIDCQDAGTCFRFLLAYFAIQEHEEKILTGTNRLKERPIADLVNALRSLGAEIIYLDKEHFAPIKIIGKKIDGGKVKINGSISSQFISALCLIAPKMKNGLRIEIDGEISSTSYILQTLNCLKEVGIKNTFKKNCIEIKPQHINFSTSINIEKDWSSACFFYCILLLSQKNKTIETQGLHFQNLKLNTLQGDEAIVSLCKNLNVETFEKENELVICHKNMYRNFPEKETYNLLNAPDLSIPFIVAASMLHREVSFLGLKSLVLKESNRIEALKEILIEIGIEPLWENDELVCKQKNENVDFSKTIKINTHNDHRIAMAGSLLAVLGFHIILSESKSVAKSFPSFWKEMEELGFEIKY
ncbi:MAG: hypothetical protein KA275_04020 [Chitinophagaceae bacterium]|nr:hypothetical protein [Chitinophagaceae bacterium]